MEIRLEEELKTHSSTHIRILNDLGNRFAFPNLLFQSRPIIRLEHLFQLRGSEWHRPDSYLLDEAVPVFAID
jgi:hypothetical protein